MPPDELPYVWKGFGWMEGRPLFGSGAPFVSVIPAPFSGLSSSALRCRVVFAVRLTRRPDRRRPEQTDTTR